MKGEVEINSEKFHTLKEYVNSEKDRIYTRHKFGVSGKEIVDELTALADKVIERLYSESLSQCNLPKPKDINMAIVALGGYGRGELNPFSDIDLMLLYKSDGLNPKMLQPVASYMITSLWDLGYEVGHSFRSIKDCVRAIYDDPLSKTSMLEARYITGDRFVFSDFEGELSKHFFKKRVNSFISIKIKEWKERHETYGSTVYVQEPDVKESVGGLRDIHAAMWVARARYGVKSLEELSQKGIISETMFKSCEASLSFIWRFRNELHYISKRRNDKLSAEIREKVAKNLGYTDDEYVLSEEKMMRDYFLHTKRLYEFSKNVMEKGKRDASKSKFFGYFNWSKHQTLESGYFLIGDELHLEKSRHATFEEDPVEILRVFQKSQNLGSTLSADLRDAIIDRLKLVDDYVRYSPDAAKIFLQILGAKSGVSKTLRRMHELEVLDRYIPEFSHLRCLVRYDQYHKYTVDEHIFFAIENLEEETLAKMPNSKQFIELLNSMDEIELLRLATLLHDIGKGVNTVIGHSKIGEEMTEKILKRMGIFSEEEAEMVRFLVSKHLEMSIVAQQRDISDPKALSDFVDFIQTPQRLNMLYLLSFADKRAVEPELWTDWTAVLFREVYSRTYRYLVEGAEESLTQLEEIQTEVKRWLKGQVDPKHIQRHFDTMPERQLLSTPVEKIVEHIKFIEKLRDKVVIVASFPSPKTHSEIAFCAKDERGLFHKITGVLASEDINILNAQINTRQDGIILDILNVADGEAPKEISDEKLKRVENLIESVLKGDLDVEELIISSKERYTPSKPVQRQVVIPPSVAISNEASAMCTVIDVKAQDRIGLLHDITHEMVHLNLDIFLAKISTESYQAVDSFYVTDDKHQKITDPLKLEKIKRTLEEALR